MRRHTAIRICAFLCLSGASSLAAAKPADWKALAKHPDSWFRTEEGRAVVARVLSNQSSRGDWPKNVDNTASLSKLEPAKIAGNWDNGATVGEVRFLARAARVTTDPACVEAVNRAIGLILASQYPNGGWPQSALAKRYAKHITFNDGTMVGLMNLLREAATSDDFAFIGEARRAAALKAFDAGVACILKSQVTAGGKKTVWCAQHDEVTLEPRPARAFEPVSLSGGESSGILTLLMSLENPSPEVVDAIEAGAAWYDSVKITGIRQTTRDGDKVIVEDPAAPPLWARFYQIGTNRPIFSGRDSVIKYSLAEIEPERRNGYSWYTTTGKGLAERYARWQARREKDKKF